MTACDTCQSEQTGTAYGCPGCARRTTALLTEIATLAPAARAVAARQTRRGPAVHTGSAGSRLPLNLAAAQRLGSAQNALTTWARDIAGLSGGQVPTGADPLTAAARWLADGDRVERARHRQEWAELYRDVAAAERVLRGVVDGPGERELVGACPCGTALYARPGAGTATCPECQQQWNAPESRAILRRALDDMLFTAAEIATLSVVAEGDPARRQRVRKLINVWSGRGLIAIRGSNADGDPLYRFGEVEPRLQASRERQMS